MNRRAVPLLGGAVGSAILASVCCVGPLLFALLGLGGAGFLLRLEPWRPLFSVVTLGLLGLAHLAARRARSCGCEPGRTTLWGATALAAAVLAVPWILPFLPL